MKVHIETNERTSGLLKKTKEFYIKCNIELTPEEARLFPDCGTPVDELTPVYDYYDNEQERPKVIYLNPAVESESTLTVKSLGQLQECEATIIERCLQVQELLTSLQDFEIEKSYTVDLIERIKETKEDGGDDPLLLRQTV